MKKFLYITGFLLMLVGYAQQPFISSLDKTSGTANEVVTISGTGFLAAPEVYFGNGKSTGVTFVNTNLIQATVPPTATYGPVTVINSNGMGVSSSQLFSISFDNDAKAVSTFTRDAIVSQDITDLQPYDLCLCDFDIDGLLDAAITTLGSDNIRIAQNGTVTAATASLSLSSISSIPALSNKTANITCGDLNADGFPDLVATSLVAGEPFVHVFQNNGAGSFTFTKVAPTLLLPVFNGSNRQGKKVRIADIDGDGKPDLIVGSQTTDDSNLLIYRNTSSGSVSFSSTPTTIPVTGASNTGGLDVGDFNNDGKADIVVVPFRQVDVVYLLKNTSLPGSISFSLEGTTGINSERANVEIGDFDNDGLNDIAVTRTSGLEIIQNNGSFSFTPSNLNSLLLAGVTAWGLDLGDINGDGLVDVVVSSIQGDQIIYFRNSTSGSINFTVADQISTAGPARNVRIGDLNMDGKPDIAIADDSQSGFPGSFSFIINRSCMMPVITPTTGIFCTGTSFILNATSGEGVTYEWTVNGAIQGGATTNQLDVSAFAVDIAVAVKASSPESPTAICEITSSPVINLTNGSNGAGVATIDDPGTTASETLCLGESFTLTSPSTSTNFFWSGPNGFSRTTTTGSVLVAASAESVHSGTYSLIIDGPFAECLSPEVTRTISISGPPVTSVEVVSCDNGTITMQVPDFTQFSYQWVQDGSTNLGTTTSQTTSTSGTYTVVLTDGNACTYTSEAVIIPNAPVSSYSNPDFGGGATSEVCVDVAADFTATSTGDGSFSLGYTWEVEDPSATITSSTGSALNFTFNTLGVWKVRLITEYTDSFGCDVVEKNITVSADPDFTVPTTTIIKCASDQSTISLTGANTSNGDSWTWTDINDATNDLTAFANSDLVTATTGDYTATYTSGTGCVATTSSFKIDDFLGIGVTVTESIFELSGVDTTATKSDTIIFVEDQTFVTLTAKNSLGYIWTAITPGGTNVTKDIDDPSVGSVVVTPSAPIMTVTVSGQTLDACIESTDIVIISGSFTPRKSFSPNGDGLNDIWTINNSRNLDGCKVFIFDNRGATIFQNEAPFSNDEVWDGNHKGKPASEGVYYYVLKCDDSENNQTGAILLAR